MSDESKREAAHTPGPVWLILFDDRDRPPEIITDEAAARERFRRISDSWNGHLFVKVQSNSRDDPYYGANATLAAPDLAAEVERLKSALTKISGIRDSIIGCQKVNWSEHVYPLVAALDAAGFEGASYEVARDQIGTLLERTNKAEAEVERLRADLDAERRKVDALREALRNLLSQFEAYQSGWMTGNAVDWRNRIGLIDDMREARAALASTEGGA